MEHIAIAFARGNCINCHDLVVLATVQAVQLNDRVFLIIFRFAVILQAGKPHRIPHAHVVAVQDQMAALLDIALIIQVWQAQVIPVAIQVVL